MRAGAYTIHQSLTAEAAAVLKLALALARRRGHAQVTPLHVAFALLTGPAAAAASCAQPLAAFSSAAASLPSPAAPYGLLKRACLRSHPAPGAAASPAQHPLQCRALELCFNVALNRLPTSGPHSPPSSAAHFASPLIQPSPTLSNALVAALKRAQANQRRGCVDLQQPPPPPPAATAAQQQPLLAIKVELDQLVISILDDPSVSRVMREAGFSSATVKSNLEEESALMPPPSSSSSSPPPPVPPHFFLDPCVPAGRRLGLWPAQFLAPLPAQPDVCSDDVRAVLDVMVRKQGRRSSPVVVGDSVSMAESVVGELLRRLDRGEVPAELCGAHLLRLQLSYVHVRLMSRADVDARAAELRRGVDAVQPLQRGGGGGGLVVYVGDLRWALDEEQEPGAAASSYSPVEHMAAEVGRLIDDLRAASRGRAWLVATASYQTYMRWQQQQRQRRRLPLESAWALQAVVVPTGSGTGLGLALNSVHSSPSSSSTPPSGSAAPVPPAMATAQHLGQQGPPFTMAGDEQDDAQQLLLCAECSNNYEREASLVKAEAAGAAEGPRGSLPAWFVPDRPPAHLQTPHKEKYLIELKGKWSRLCRKLHLCADPCSAPCPWWSASCLPPGSQISKPSVAGFLGLDGLTEHGKQGRTTTSQWPPSPLPRWGPSPVMAPPGCHVVRTALALGGSHPLSDSATSDVGRAPGSGGGGDVSASAAARELERRLRRNIPWLAGAAAAEIAEAVVAGDGGKKGVWLYVKGSDGAAARRAATVVAEARCGSGDRVVRADPSGFSCAEELCADVVSRASEMGGEAFVVVVDDVENAPCDVVECLAAASRRGCVKDHQSGRELDLSSSVVILTASKLGAAGVDVIGLRLWAEDDAPPSGVAAKRKTAASPRSECKRARHDALDLNLNVSADEDTDGEEDDGGSDDDEEAVPSDITHEGDSGGDSSSEHHVQQHPHGVLESAAGRVVTLDEEAGHDAAASIRARLASAVAGQGRSLRVDEEAVRALEAAAGEFLEEVLERWAAEVLGPAAATVGNGGKGKVLVLGLGLGLGSGGGGAREADGFMGSVLPSRVHVD